MPGLGELEIFFATVTQRVLLLHAFAYNVVNRNIIVAVSWIKTATIHKHAINFKDVTITYLPITTEHFKPNSFALAGMLQGQFRSLETIGLPRICQFWQLLT